MQEQYRKELPIKYDRAKRSLEDKANESEISQGRSVIGSLAWIARQVRPEYCYQSSRLQSVIASAKLKHIQQCNKVLQDIQATSKIVYAPRVPPTHLNTATLEACFF